MATSYEPFGFNRLRRKIVDGVEIGIVDERDNLVNFNGAPATGTGNVVGPVGAPVGVLAAFADGSGNVLRAGVPGTDYPTVAAVTTAQTTADTAQTTASTASTAAATALSSATTANTNANAAVATADAASSAVALKADLASPALTGTPTAPTAAPVTSTTQIATTAFVTTADNLKANISGPTFTGVPSAPTATAGTSTTQLATTAFATVGVSTHAALTTAHGESAFVASIKTSADATSFRTAIGAGSGGGDVAGQASSVDSEIALFSSTTGKVIKRATTTGMVKATAGVIAAAVGDTDYALPATVALKATIASPTFTGVPAAPTAAAATNTTQVATTAFVTTADNLKANLASPTLTGTPAAPTAAAATSTTQIATTAFVQGELTAKANLASPTFTGVPAMPTAAPGTNTTQGASTAFVTAAAALKVTASGGTLTNGTLAGIYTTDGASVTTTYTITITANAGTIDVTKGLGLAAISANVSLARSGTPATANTWFGTIVTNSDSAPHIVTFDSSHSQVIQANRTTCPIAAGGKLWLLFRFNGVTYEVFGDSAYFSKYDATAAPAVTDDVASGYGPGSLWLNATANTLYICESNGAGAAVWNAAGGAGGSGTVTSITLTQPAAGFTITGSGTPATTTGSFTFALTNDLAALEGLSSTGIAARVGANTWSLVPYFDAAAGISSAGGAPDIGAQSSLNVAITGSTTITSFGTVAAGTTRFVTFTGAPLLTHNATSLILLGGTNIQANAGSSALMYSLGSGNWQMISYARNAVPVNGDSTLGAFAATTSAALAGVISDETGTGALVFATSPTFVTPALGTPASGTLTNCTIPGSAITGLATGVATLLATPTSANLAAAITDETGSGALVFATSPTFVTPALGTPASGTLTNCTIPGSAITGLASGVITLLTTPTSANLAAAITDETGSGALVFATSPTLVTPALGTPASGVLTNCTGLPAASITGLATGVATFLAASSSANLKAAVTDETGTGGALVFATGPTLSGPIVQLDALPGTDDTYQGTAVAGRNAGATIAQWEAVYLDSSGTWQLADANGTNTYPCRGLAVAAYVNTNAAVVLDAGVARNDAWAWTIGGDVYLSTTAGALTQTAPSTSGDKIQKVGYALTADSIRVNIGSGEYMTVN